MPDSHCVMTEFCFWDTVVPALSKSVFMLWPWHPKRQRNPKELTEVTRAVLCPPANEYLTNVMGAGADFSLKLVSSISKD